MSLTDANYANSNLEATTDTIRRDELFVGPGLKLKLEVSVCDTFNLEGDVEGKVKAKHIVMSATGRFAGDAQVDSARIDGSFEGSLTVLGLLQVGNTGRINGTLRYKEIEVERNGQLRGNIDTVESELKLSAEAAIDPAKKTVEQLLSDVASKHKEPDSEAPQPAEHIQIVADAEEKQPRKFFF